MESVLAQVLPWVAFNIINQKVFGNSPLPSGASRVTQLELDASSQLNFCNYECFNSDLYVVVFRGEVEKPIIKVL